MIIGEHDYVMGAWAESAAGPGWSNRLIWVCIRSALDGSYRMDCFQPEEQTPGMLAIYSIANVVSAQLTAECKREARRLRDEAGRKPAPRGRKPPLRAGQRRRRKA